MTRIKFIKCTHVSSMEPNFCKDMQKIRPCSPWLKISSFKLNTLYNNSKILFCMLRRLRSFQRGNVGLCRLTGFKATSCQSWRMILLSGNRTRAALGWFEMGWVTELSSNLKLWRWSDHPGLKPGPPAFGSNPAARQNFVRSPTLTACPLAYIDLQYLFRKI